MLNQVEISYHFNAPCELVFKAFTDSEHLQNWWGPKGWTFNVAESDFRSGGVFHYSQKPTDGDTMWVKFVYSEIIASEKIVYISFFSDEKGDLVRAPFDQSWPMKTLNTLTFSVEGGETAITLTVAPASPTEEELQTFDASLEMVQAGFTGTLNQLTEYLTKI
ncbi:hypothetical protein PAEAM_03410 [Paenibacillus sp. GM1FR]|uniref:SRPBCC family protein n=1 Tax=Paenibacillus sp. GM1FR TaxID=2059267 RepID=UPI000C279C1E|nr:SRPBCC domain-containing protein [Paenibacillus sp. GM1FR]PJN65989.1 hypothetical protein PAEAM_03410 [Paenibacillus sp. GM1FR]